MAVETVDPKSEMSEFQLPLSSYELVEAKPLASDERFVASELDGDGDLIARVASQVIAKAPASKRIVQHAANAAHAVKADAEHLERSSTKMYVALAAGLGILTSLAVVAFVLMPGKSADT